jgi:hypothetical protein
MGAVSRSSVGSVIFRSAARTSEASRSSLIRKTKDHEFIAVDVLG